MEYRSIFGKGPATGELARREGSRAIRPAGPSRRRHASRNDHGYQRSRRERDTDRAHPTDTRLARTRAHSRPRKDIERAQHLASRRGRWRRRSGARSRALRRRAHRGRSLRSHRHRADTRRRHRGRDRNSTSAGPKRISSDKMPRLSTPLNRTNDGLRWVKDVRKEGVGGSFDGAKGVIRTRTGSNPRDRAGYSLGGRSNFARRPARRVASLAK